jgi:hypothetical protein
MTLSRLFSAKAAEGIKYNAWASLDSFVDVSADELCAYNVSH